MRQAYLDCSSGISGDMFLGALLDAGVAPQKLLDELKKVPLGFYELKRTRAVRGGLVGTRVEITVPAGHPERKLAEIERLLKSSSLAESRSEEHTSELQSPCNLVCRLLLEKKKASS